MPLLAQIPPPPGWAKNSARTRAAYVKTLRLFGIHVTWPTT